MSPVEDLVAAAPHPAFVSLDEGGLRCLAEGTEQGSYVPFSALADASIDHTLFGRTVLLLAASEGRDEASLPISNPNPHDLLGAILRELAGRKGGKAARRLPDALQRNERDLETWLADARRWALGAGGYRQPALDRADLAAAVTDAHADVEDRAVAAHLLLDAGDDAETQLVARTFVFHALPPLVLVAAWLAPGGGILVEDELIDDLKKLVSVPDRRVIDRFVIASTAARPTADTARAARIGEALQRAKEEAAEEVRRQASSAPHASHRRGLQHPSAAGSDAARWVGRTWAI